VARTAPVGPTHAVCGTSGATVRGLKAETLEVLNEDWEAACLSRSALTASPPSSPAGPSPFLVQRAGLAC
jgi:hypothetical protein